MVTAGKSRERAAPRAHGDRRRDPRGRARQARRAPRAHARAARRALRRTRPQRIGLSATQRPIETIARLLVGAGAGRVDAAGAPVCARSSTSATGARSTSPSSCRRRELEAVASQRAVGRDPRPHRRATSPSTARRSSSSTPAGWPSGSPTCWPSASARTRSPRTTAASRRTGGSRVEERLRAGELRALVATASLELGIDIGPVELVCQIGSPRSLATFLQRVGRSGHARGATSEGPPLPDDARRAGRVRRAPARRARGPARPRRCRPSRRSTSWRSRSSPSAPREQWGEDELYALVRRAAPYAELAREDFDDVVDMLAEGIQHGPRPAGARTCTATASTAWCAGRRGARIAALTSGGAIPETADYRVVADPDDTFVGTVNEDWAIESMAGDVFLLGSTSWRIRRVEAGHRARRRRAGRAADRAVLARRGARAHRRAVRRRSRQLRERVGERLAEDDTRRREGVAHRRVRRRRRGGARQIVGYLGAAQLALGVLPTNSDLVFERFFDEAGGMQLVVHAPFGGRINRALGLALRKRFCAPFDFELQAAASDDAVVLSLGPAAQLPARGRRRASCRRGRRRGARAGAARSRRCSRSRWRWNLDRALVVLRQRGGRRNPPPIQRMEADDLMAAVFPALAGCQENAQPARSRSPTTRSIAPDDVRLPARGDGHRRARRAARGASRPAPCGCTSSTRPSPRRCRTRS